MDCLKCLKYMVFFFNLIFWLCGMAVLGIAIWLRLDQDSVEYVAAADQGMYYTACYILMGAGGLMTLIGFLGCCGAYQEHRCMLAAFFSFLLLILLAEVGAGVYAFLEQKQIEDGLNTSLTKFIQAEYGHGSARTEAIDKLQRALECCGASNYEDYHKSVFRQLTGKTLSYPDSCCTENACTGTNYHKTGCSAAIVEWFKEHLTIVMIVGFSVGLVEILGMVFSMSLCCLLHRRYDGYK